MPNAHEDYIFHISMRPEEKQIVRNMDREGEWGSEERFGGFPVAVGEPFDLNILAEENQFVISINGQHFCDFAYRKPLDQARYIQFLGIAESLTITNPLEHDQMESDSETIVIV